MTRCRPRPSFLPHYIARCRPGDGPTARQHTLRAALMIGAALGGLPLSAPVAQTRTLSAASHEARRLYAIDAGTLSQTLSRFAHAAGIDLLVDASLLEGKRSAGLSGRHSVREAFDILLQGSGLETISASNGNWQLRVRTSPGPGVSTLSPVQVVGQHATAWGPAPGYIAQRSATGTKTATRLSEIPQSVSAVTAQEMRARGAQSVVQAIQYTPGVQVNNFGGNEIRNDWVVLRGFDAKLTGDYRDGLSQLPYDQIRARMPAYALERVEILRGPSSVLFGQVAPGGIVNRITKRPVDETLREVELQAGSFRLFQAAADLGGPIDEAATHLYRLTMVGRDAGTQEKYDSSHRYQDDTIYVAPAYTWQPSAATSLTVLAHYQRDRNDGESRPVYPTRALVGDYSFDKNDRELYSLGWLFEHQFNDRLTVRQNARMQHGDMTLRNLYQLSMAPDGHTLNRYALVARERARGFVVDNQMELRAGTGPLSHQLLLGLDARRQLGQSEYRQGSAPSLDLLNPQYGQSVPYPDETQRIIDQDETSTQVGLYLQDQIKWNRWILTLGARQDWARSTLDNHLNGSQTRQRDAAFTWRAGLGHAFDSGLVPYASYATSFLPQSGVNRAGEAFVPTRGKQYEVGIKYEPPGGKSLYTLALFELRQDNALTPDPDYPTFSVQTGEIRSRGVELEAKVEVQRGWDVVASLTYNQVEVTRSNDASLGHAPIVTPRRMASLWLHHTVQGGLLAGLGLGVGVRHVGPTYADVRNTLRNPSATYFDAALNYERGRWRLGLSINNLFDRQTVVCRNNLTNCRYGMERSVLGSVAYRY